MASVVVEPKQWSTKQGYDMAIKQAATALRECGFVYLDEFYSRELIDQWRQAYDDFRASPESEPFSYPCQVTNQRRTQVPTPHLTTFRFLNIRP